METVEENVKLSQEEKLRRLKEAKDGTWYDGWKTLLHNVFLQ